VGGSAAAMAATAADPAMFSFYIAPGMLVEAQREAGAPYEPAVVSGMPRDVLGAWELTGGEGGSAWTQQVRYERIRPRRRFAAPAVAASPGASSGGAASPAGAVVVPHAAEIREMNTDCDSLEARIAALEAKRAAAAADAADAANPLLNLADVAANITHDDLRAELEHHVATARSSGVRFLVTPSMSADGPRGARQTLALARAHPGRVLPCAGVHPFWAAALVGAESRVDGADCVPGAVEALREIAASREVVAVGECWLDFSKPPTEAGGYPARDAQLRWFEAQVSLAVELKKPLYLHERDAFAEFVGAHTHSQPHSHTGGRGGAGGGGQPAILSTLYCSVHRVRDRQPAYRLGPRLASRLLLARQRQSRVDSMAAARRASHSVTS
jgi:hypothetical protein